MTELVPEPDWEGALRLTLAVRDEDSHHRIYITLFEIRHRSRHGIGELRNDIEGIAGFGGQQP
jgi:hypothetical protein